MTVNIPGTESPENVHRLIGELLKSRALGDGHIKRDTAMLIIHGIGDQQPLDTLDAFSRGIINSLQNDYKNLSCTYKQHVKLERNAGTLKWFNNVLEICDTSTNRKLAIYECYWANLTEDKVSAYDIRRWIAQVTGGAKKFYKNQAMLLLLQQRKSKFLKDGQFDYRKYFRMMNIAGTLPSLQRAITSVIGLIAGIPFFGAFASVFFADRLKKQSHDLTNLLGAVVVYNTVDARASSFVVRKAIMEEALCAVEEIMTPNQTEAGWEFPFDNVVVCGHSLGTEIAFDAINHLTHLVNENQIPGLNNKGVIMGGTRSIKDVFGGFVTFGSPLDKIAFFFREQTQDEQYLKRQFVYNYNCFKQKNWIAFSNNPITFVKPFPTALFREVKWTNYYDSHDAVSGNLDFYSPLTNVDCQFPAPGRFAFTHSNYWTTNEMFKEILYEMVL